MAKRTIVSLIDDVDGTEAQQTVSFAFQGVAYEIDLNDDHAKALEESFTDWIASARRVSTSAGSTGGRPTGRSAIRSELTQRAERLQAVRSWLREHGHSVADRGRISRALMDLYDEAH